MMQTQNFSAKLKKIEKSIYLIEGKEFNIGSPKQLGEIIYNELKIAKLKKTNAKQANHNLLLSPNAKINSIPILEIYEDDVQCAHGSTTGQIDEEAIFYLQSRGLNRNDAIELIVRGFTEEIINKINNANFKNMVKNIMIEKMNTVIY